MRRAARVDGNQTQIVDALRKAGCSVLSLASVGGGCPDLVVGVRGKNLLIEVKDGSKCPSKRSLTPDELEFFEHWKGCAMIVESVAQALLAVKML